MMPPQPINPLDAALRRALAVEADPQLRAWASALLAGDDRQAKTPTSTAPHARDARRVKGGRR